MKNLTFSSQKFSLQKLGRTLLMLPLMLAASLVNAQDLADGQAAIEEAATGIEGYFDSIQTLVVRLVTL